MKAYGQWVIAEGWNRAHWHETVRTIHGDHIARMSCGRTVRLAHLVPARDSDERCKVCRPVRPIASRPVP